ncbi:hypothetical protein GOB93_12135 [Acetobacter musti]|uniref:Uncharacterized protein n=2 Tax=Acetobacter musti TaxID=864732 RepID=A0ABX0JRF1_9PROT|nr:hypothetical protein [Acetobacter musti]
MQIMANTVEQTSASLSVVADSDAGSSQKTSLTLGVVKASSFIPVVNPASHIDPALGIVVVEKYGSDGAVADQYPTAHMLQQYSLFGFSSGSDT